MKYDLLYYKNIPQPNGGEVRLEIYKGVPEDEILYPLPRVIGDVLAGLRLDIGGQMGEVDEPIVKTSLTFSLVDAPELNNNNQKCGNWEEFYTSNAVGFKVVLLGKKKGDADFSTMWSGYITPDNYIETLQYHGVVTVTARDNIGHLADFEFDAKGNADQMITPYELINQAWEKIASPMVLEWRGASDSNYWPQTGGVDAVETYINVSAFKDKTWYDAVSETLYSLGLVMRYVGGNRVFVCPLRRLPCQSEETVVGLPHIAPLFEAYATRELSPAVKEIKEVVEYDLEEGVDVPNVGEDDFTGTTGTCEVNAVDIWGSTTKKTVVVWPLANQGETGWGNIRSSTLFFFPFAYNNLLAQLTNLEEQMFLATNTNDRMVWFGRYINCQRMQMTWEHGIPIVKRTDGIMRAFNEHTVKSITGAIKLTVDGKEYYYDGKEFKATYAELTIPFEEGVMKQDLEFHKLNGQRGLLQFFVFRVNVEWTLGYPNALGEEGVYMGFRPLNFSIPYAGSLMEKNTIKTVYNEANNVMMSRAPELGPAFDDVAMPGLIPNGIFRKDGGNYVITEKWGWPWEDDGQQLGVMIHKQLLCYCDKPNSILSGTLLNADMINPRVIWEWKGARHLLVSGSFNYINGRVENAVLKEFKRYEDLWN